MPPKGKLTGKYVACERCGKIVQPYQDMNNDKISEYNKIAI